ncbi:hypothetical protein Tco_0561871 [Tanacetum coccineum]
MATAQQPLPSSTPPQPPLSSPPSNNRHPYHGTTISKPPTTATSSPPSPPSHHQKGTLGLTETPPRGCVVFLNSTKGALGFGSAPKGALGFMVAPKGCVWLFLTPRKDEFGSNHTKWPRVRLVSLTAPRGAFGFDSPRKGVFVYGFKQPKGCLVLGLTAAKRAVWFSH